MKVCKLKQVPAKTKSQQVDWLQESIDFAKIDETTVLATYRAINTATFVSRTSLQVLLIDDRTGNNDTPFLCELDKLSFGELKVKIFESYNVSIEGYKTPLETIIDKM
jgi:hypothetical protein